jgi:hypothetical protein
MIARSTEPIASNVDLREWLVPFAHFPVQPTSFVDGRAKHDMARSGLVLDNAFVQAPGDYP